MKTNFESQAHETLSISGLYSVAFTDIIQLICIFVGLIFSIPWMTQSEHVTMPLQTSNVKLFEGTTQDYSKFFGKLNKEDAGVWVRRIFGVLYQEIHRPSFTLYSV